ncbi:MAG: hypothetical protein ACYC5J_04070 [Chloroflexota bacterium]
MVRRNWLGGLVVALAIPIAALTTLFTAGAAPSLQEAALAVQMNGATQGGGREILYSITLVNSSSSDVRDVYVTGSIPSGTKFSAATATPQGAAFRGEENGAAAWVVPVVPAGGKQGPFSYKVSVTAAPADPAHAWVRWLSPGEGIGTSEEVTWQAAAAAGGPRRGCQACHALADRETGKYTLAYEAHERVEVDYGRDHPTVAPDGTSIKPTDQTGPEVCLLCHKPGTGAREGRGAFAPITLRDIVHPAHLFSETFVEHYGGGCFTCHNVRGDGTFELLGGKVEVNEKGVPRSLLSGKGSIPGSIAPSEGIRISVGESR